MADWLPTLAACIAVYVLLVGWTLTRRVGRGGRALHRAAFWLAPLVPAIAWFALGDTSGEPARALGTAGWLLVAPAFQMRLLRRTFRCTVCDTLSFPDHPELPAQVCPACGAYHVSGVLSVADPNALTATKPAALEPVLRRPSVGTVAGPAASGTASSDGLASATTPIRPAPLAGAVAGKLPVAVARPTAGAGRPVAPTAVRAAAGVRPIAPARPIGAARPLAAARPPASPNPDASAADAGAASSSGIVAMQAEPATDVDAGAGVAAGPNAGTKADDGAGTDEAQATARSTAGPGEQSPAQPELDLAMSTPAPRADAPQSRSRRTRGVDATRGSRTSTRPST